MALLGLVIWFLLGSVPVFGFGFDIGTGPLNPVGSYLVSADAVDSLSIDWTSGAVYIGTHHGDDILVTEFARRNLRAGEELSLNTDGGTLSIYFTEQSLRFSLGINNTTKRLEILVPYSLSDSWDGFQINTVSGRVTISDMQANDFVVGTVSGRIELSGITATALNASTTSGRIELRSVQADDIQLHTVSGRIEMRNTQTDNLRTNTTSGRHELSGSFGYVNARSTSGRIEIESTIVPERLTARTASGRIGVTVPNEGPISVEHSSTSGRFSSDIPVITHGGAEAQFHLTTTSGRIQIFAR